ncbi:MAG: phospholipid/cholesterol/gamma-HCH transport system substrate-binding protein [Pseudohongiellaceae bacterium]|jgi:phospholipid/cholesterol/gamma-HCH transport system substrate-binding protein
MKKHSSDVFLGLIFFGSLIGLGLVTIVLSDFAFDTERHEVVMYSENVGFLRTGDPVLIHGMSSGKVAKIERLLEPLPEANSVPGDLHQYTVRLTCIMELDPTPYLYTDHRIIIEDRGVLGGKLIRIEIGRSGEVIPADEPLIAVASPSVIQAVGTLIDENRESIKSTIDNISEVAERASEGQGALGMLLSDEGLGEQVQELVTNLTSFSSKLEGGDSTLNRLLDSTEIYDKAQSFLADLKMASTKIAAGEGSVGRFIMEEDAHDSVKTLLADISRGVDDATASLSDLRAGKGTLGKLVNDDELHGQVSSFMDDIAVLSGDLREGKGTMGKLFSTDELHENANEMIDIITDAASSLREGDGLLARLIDDGELADTLESILDQVLGAIEDARETAPVQSLGSFLFGTF